MLPTINLGDTVLFQYGEDQWPAIVTKVWSPACVNLCVLPSTGLPYNVTSSSLGTGHEQWQHRQTEQPVAPITPTVQ